MNELSTISIGNNKIRTAQDPEEDTMYFVADVAHILSYGESNAITRQQHYPSQKYLQIPGVSGRGFSVVNERDLCVMIAQSNKPAAKALVSLLMGHVYLTQEKILGLFADLDIEDASDYYVYAIQAEGFSTNSIGCLLSNNLELSIFN